MTALYLGEMIRRFSVGPLAPVNREHSQAHASYVHAACLQAITDDGAMSYSPEAARTFPYLENIAERSESELAFWSDRFWTWYCALGDYDRKNLQSEICVLSDETSPELLTGRTKVS